MSSNPTTSTSQYSCDSNISTSTVDFDEEPFETFKDKVLKLCRNELDMPKGSVKVERLTGGTYNRVVNLQSPDKDWILRIPRLFHGNPSMFHDIGPLELLQDHPGIPVPKVLCFDHTDCNSLELAYMVQERVPGQCLVHTYRDLSHQTKCAIAKDLGHAFSEMHQIRNQFAGKLFWTEEIMRVQPLNPSHRDFYLPRHVARASESTEQFILELLHDRLEIATERLPDKDAAWKVKSLNKLIPIVKEMGRMGIWDTAYSYCFCHLDLEPRNVMADEKGITAILDWDSAMFAPFMLSCQPPHVDMVVA
ncbi:uncharacterized protein N7483_010679 [Penicillium malachiteum]|uniref:uncharacterized protein n=1 Tax=Penicillium malachiteum TaxID=1324776 RepID=UPI002546FF71|nr:uncharacterized protein N7483_010679 [Penicillium malachiteum]KAJ5713498.1 hypothetical protein N7483_010679 [Penicillium malachiteum]